MLDAVRTSVHPKVIDCPNPNSGISKITSVAKDGIAVNVRARVTVRTNIQQLIGGATEQTIIARVGEGIVSAIGSSETHKAVLANPDRISKAVLARSLDGAERGLDLALGLLIVAGLLSVATSTPAKGSSMK